MVTQISTIKLAMVALISSIVGTLILFSKNILARQLSYSIGKFLSGATYVHVNNSLIHHVLLLLLGLTTYYREF